MKIFGKQGGFVRPFSKKGAARKLAKQFAIPMATAMALVSAPSYAALDAAVTTLITDLTTDVGLLFAAVVVMWAAIRGFKAVFRLGNMFISKAGA